MHSEWGEEVSITSNAHVAHVARPNNAAYRRQWLVIHLEIVNMHGAVPCFVIRPV